jgi:DNA-binding NtrC family response regulator
MLRPSSDLNTLANVPIERLLPLAAEKLKHATFEELATILSGKATVVPSTDQLAEMILALPPESGSKLERIQTAVVMHAVSTSGGNVSAAARLLGMGRSELRRKFARARRAAKRG